jgi:hypothetical protein
MLKFRQNNLFVFCLIVIHGNVKNNTWGAES